MLVGFPPLLVVLAVSVLLVVGLGGSRARCRAGRGVHARREAVVVVVELGALRVGRRKRRSAEAGDEGCGGGTLLLVGVGGGGGRRRRREERPEGGARQWSRKRKKGMRPGVWFVTARRKHERGRAQAGHRVGGW